MVEIKLPMIDLHIHSCFSDDGELSPQAIVDLALSTHLKVVAITDHNSVKAIQPTLECINSELTIIPGIEIDCTYQGINLHLLGYHFDWTHPAYQQIEQQIITQEQQASQLRIQLIQAVTGLQLNVGEVLAASKNGVVTGELIAHFLMNHPANQHSPILQQYFSGERSDRPYVNFYWDFFSQGKPCYVPIEYPAMEQVIELIHETKGVAIIAHPGVNLVNHHQVLVEMVQCGIDGIEVISTYHSPAQAQEFYLFAKANQLMMSCGSDFHGINKPDILLGEHADDNRIMLQPEFQRGLMQLVNYSHDIV